jgi:hypothetical protein
MNLSARMATWVLVVVVAAVGATTVASFAQSDVVKAGLAKLGFPADTEARALAGKFVEASLPTASERDLNAGIVFFVKQAPETFAKQLREDMLAQKVDPNMIAFGELKPGAGPAQFSALKLTPAQVKAYGGAKAGDDLNLSAEEIAALNAASKDPAKLQETVRAQLQARFDAYRTKGLAGLAPYARGGSKRDLAGDFAAVISTGRKAALLPSAFYDLLDGYPKGAPAGLVEKLYWAQFKANGEDTIALTHSFQGTFGGMLVIVQRQYYVSTGYNLEQAIAGFVPLQGGTLVVYGNHTSTDQVAGFAGGTKRSIGRKVMSGELKKLFEQTRTAAAK